MKKTILSVDEFGATRAELSNLLKSLDINVIGVRDEIEAINILFENKKEIAAITWTINTVDSEGYHSIKRIKSKDAYKNIPIIIVSKFTDKRFVIKAIESGAVEYIVKPYDEIATIKKFGTILGISPGEKFNRKKHEDIVVFNFNELLTRDIKAASRGGYAVSLLMASIVPSDPLLQATENLDEIIDVIVKVMNTKLRETDALFRYGGNNLVFILPFANAEGVKSVIKKVHHIFNTHSIIKQKSAGYGLVSASVTFPDDGKIKDKLLEKLEQNFSNNLKALKA